MKERQSNMELLRLICMFYILVHHSIVQVLPLTMYTDAWSTEAKIIDMFVYCAVNVFILISGYFGIKPSVKSFFNLYFQLAFYQFVLCLGTMICHAGKVGKWMFVSPDLWTQTLLPFTHSPWWWFLTAYLGLYLLSPILNAAIKSMSKKEHLMALVLLTVVNVYLGFGFDAERNLINSNGYHVMNFMYLYFIGRYISKHINVMEIKSWISALVYAVSSFGLGVMSIFHISGCRLTDTYPYNHPLLIIAAVALFLLFTKLTFQSKIVNWFASSALSIYLIHEYYSINVFLYSLAANSVNNTPPIHSLILMPILLILFMFVCILVDKIRCLITTPIVSFINSKIVCQK